MLLSVVVEGSVLVVDGLDVDVESVVGDVLVSVLVLGALGSVVVLGLDGLLGSIVVVLGVDGLLGSMVVVPGVDVDGLVWPGAGLDVWAMVAVERVAAAMPAMRAIRMIFS